MGAKKKRRGRPPLAAGRPSEGGRTEAGARPGKRKPGRPPKRRKKTKHRTYTPEEKRAALEAFHQSGMTQVEFCRVWGVSHGTFKNWLARYETTGPKGLERKPHAGKGKIRLAGALREEIVRAKRFFPSFGLKRIRDYLYRFRGFKVSPGSIKKTLKAAEDTLPPPPAPKKAKRKKKRKPPRRFERSKPGALWQSDITSFVLSRHSTRVYLTIFMDDYSRYVVSFVLALHQKQDLVTEGLLSGIDRFGKPKEVLTDQGRQYFAWRGKSGFQKLLDKQGIRHVVARSHHPQTLGKCERFWKTINEEFWCRAQPKELDEARERLTHFIAHYNHHRPHQGIGGLVPADRFFGAESEVRAQLEALHTENELRLALSEPPRQPVYLVGRIGDREVSMHGERGKLVIHAPDGEVEQLSPSSLGMAEMGGSDERSDTDDEHDGRDEEPETPMPQTLGAHFPAEAGGPAGAGPLGGGRGRGEEESPRDGHGAPGAVAGPDHAPGGGEPVEASAPEDLAAFPAGDLGPLGGSLEATQAAGEARGPWAGGCPLETSGENRQAGEGGEKSSQPGGTPEGVSGPSGASRGQGGEACPSEEEEEEERERKLKNSSSPSENGWPSRKRRTRNGPSWPGLME
jgi:transposase InsO family protein/transposase-like protein